MMEDYGSLSVEDRLKLAGLSKRDAFRAYSEKEANGIKLGLNDHDAFCWRSRCR